MFNLMAGADSMFLKSPGNEMPGLKLDLRIFLYEPTGGNTCIDPLRLCFNWCVSSV